MSPVDVCDHLSDVNHLPLSGGAIGKDLGNYGGESRAGKISQRQNICPVCVRPCFPSRSQSWKGRVQGVSV